MDARFLVDVNLPYYFSLWHSKEFIHQSDIDESWSDTQIWSYAKEHNLIIITKYTDFYEYIMISDSPPKVIHLRIGNMRLKEFHQFLNEIWEEVREMILINKLVTVYPDRIECLKGD